MHAMAAENHPDGEASEDQEDVEPPGHLAEAPPPASRSSRSRVGSSRRQG